MTRDATRCEHPQPSALGRQPSALSRRDTHRFYLFVAPWLVGLVLFQLGPMVGAVGLSLTDWQLVERPEWQGLAHYRALADDELFHTSLRNTAYYALGSVPLGVALAFGLALLLNRPWPGMGFFRTVFFMPALVSGVAVAMAWGWLFNPRLGAVNSLLGGLGLPQPGWLAEPRWAMPTVILLSLWSVGGTMLVFVAGLQTIPRDLYDAARIDGANRLTLVRHITLPMVSPVTFFLLVVGTIASLQLFTPTYILTDVRAGTRESTITLPLYIYQNAFQYGEYGYAAALTVVLIGVTLALTVLQVGLARRWVFYAGTTGWGGR